MKIKETKKIIEKYIVVSIIIIISMICINTLNIQVYASTNTIEGTENKKSNNANLDNLGIKPYDFYGFEEDILEYTIAVPETTKEVEIYAKVQDKNATVTGTNDINLELGKNISEVTVVAEDGTTKIYTINIIRDNNEYNYQKKIGNSGVFKNIDKGLQTLEIEGIQLDKEFDTNIYEYSCKVDDNITDIKINSVSTNSEYVVDIIGNNNLEEGKNFVTILVSHNDKNIATYQITVEKPLKQMSIMDSAGNIFTNFNIQYIYVFWVIIAVIIIFIVIRKIYKKIKKNKKSKSIDSKKDNNKKNSDNKETSQKEEVKDKIELPKGLKNMQKDIKKNKKEVVNTLTEKGKRYKNEN